METEKKRWHDLLILIMIVFAYTALGATKIQRFHEGLFLITLMFSFLFGYKTILKDSACLNGETVKPVLTVIISVVLPVSLLMASQDGFRPLIMFNDKFVENALKAPIVEELLWRGLILGITTKISGINLEKRQFKATKLEYFCFQKIQEKKVIEIVMVNSLLFSFFHLRDLLLSTPSMALYRFFGRTAIGFSYCLLYLISGKKVHPSILLHYANNAYVLANKV